MESILVLGFIILLVMLALFILSPFLIGALFIVERVFSLFPMSKREVEYLKSLQKDG